MRLLRSGTTVPIKNSTLYKKRRKSRGREECSQDSLTYEQKTSWFPFELFGGWSSRNLLHVLFLGHIWFGLDLWRLNSRKRGMAKPPRDSSKVISKLAWRTCYLIVSGTQWEFLQLSIFSSCLKGFGLLEIWLPDTKSLTLFLFSLQTKVHSVLFGRSETIHFPFPFLSQGETRGFILSNRKKV